MDLLLPVFQLLYFVAHFLYSLAESVGNTWRLITQMKSWLHNTPRGTAITTVPLTGASPTLYNALPKIPRHVGIVSASPLVDAASVASVIGWIAAYGVQEVSVHDVHGDLASRKLDIIKEIEKMDVSYLYRVRERNRDSEAENRARDVGESQIKDRERDRMEEDKAGKCVTMPIGQKNEPIHAGNNVSEENGIERSEIMPVSLENRPTDAGSEGRLVKNDESGKNNVESEVSVADSEGTCLVGPENEFKFDDSEGNRLKNAESDHICFVSDPENYENCKFGPTCLGEKPKSEVTVRESEGDRPKNTENEVKVGKNDLENDKKCKFRPTFLEKKPKSEITIPESDGLRNAESEPKCDESVPESDQNCKFRPSRLGEKRTGTESDQNRPAPSTHTLRYRPTGQMKPTPSENYQNSQNSENRPTFTLTFLGLRDGREDLARVAERLAVQYSHSLHSLSGTNSKAKSGFVGLKEMKNVDFSLGRSLGGLGSLEKQHSTGLPCLEEDVLDLGESSISVQELEKQNSICLGELEKQNLGLGNSQTHSSQQGSTSISLPKASDISSLLAMAPLADPELVISLGRNSSLGLFSTLGYPPWRLRASEIHSLGLSEGLPGLQRVMEAYAGCEQRWGK